MDFRYQFLSIQTDVLNFQKRKDIVTTGIDLIAEGDGIEYQFSDLLNQYNHDSDNDNIGDACDDCNDMAGDLNDDLVIDVLDLVNLVNIILVVNQNPSDCELSDADYNNDSIVNIQDVILVITNILN